MKWKFMSKEGLLFSMLFVLMVAGSSAFGQSLNDYKYVVVKKQYAFQEGINEYRLNSNAAFMLREQGFTVLYDDELLPDDLTRDRCKAMYFDMERKEAFMATKLGLVLRDCNKKVLFESEGLSKEKTYKTAYNEALQIAMKAVKAQGYKYKGDASANDMQAGTTVSHDQLLTATTINNGFVLSDSEGRKVMTILKTSSKDCFLATKGNLQGVLISKDYQWFFEYYLNGEFYSEKVRVVF